MDFRKYTQRHLYNNSHYNLHSNYDFRKRKFKLNFSVSEFFCLIALIFVILNSPFGAYFGEFNVGAEGESQLDAIKVIYNNPSIIKFGEKVNVGGFDVNGAYIYLMLISLILAIVFFLIGTIGVNWAGTIGGVLSVIYAGFNYLIVREINSQIGLFQFMGGVTFGISGWIALIVGFVYLIWLRE